MYWTTSSGRIELNITKRQAAGAYHRGDCERDVAELCRVPAIAKQSRVIDPAELREELSQWGAWDETELADHAQNLQRLVWLACGDVVDGNN